jgi:hypothetical protein
MKTLEWKYSKIYHDWSLLIELPRGSIKGTISFSNSRPQDYTTWGTVEYNMGKKHKMTTIKYDNPTDAVDVISRSIMTAMADIINNVSRLN